MKKKEETDIQPANENALAIAGNEELVKMYRENAKLGSENLANELPLLKIHAVGRSQSQLADGREPADGAFFYKPTREQFTELTCHILTISRGFKADGFEGKKDVFHQILSGVIVDGAEMKPFMMYITGLKLSNLWKFGKEASPFTRAKPVPIPMFALTVKLTTSKEKHSYGSSWIVNFEIVKNEKSIPEVVTDPGLFIFLRDNVSTVEETVNSLIANKSGEGSEGLPAAATTVINDELAPPPTNHRHLDEVRTSKLTEDESREDVPF